MLELTTKLFNEFQGVYQPNPGRAATFVPRGWTLIQNHDRSIVVCGALHEVRVQKVPQDPRIKQRESRQLIVRFHTVVRRGRFAPGDPGWCPCSQAEFVYDDPYAFRVRQQPAGVLTLTSGVSGELLLFVPWDPTIARL